MFKKFIYIVLIVCSICFLRVSNSKPVFAKFASEYEICVGEKYNGKFYNANNFNYYLHYEIAGESCVLNKNYSIIDIVNYFNAEEVFTEEINTNKIIYYYSPKIKYLQVIKGERVNLQVCITEKNIKVGAPLIFGSF